jgi:transcriptional regulator with XRE-family HTH domain
VDDTKAEVILAENLKLYRKQHHLSQERMAERCNLSVRGYGKIENCEVTTLLKSLDKISEGIGMTQAELLTDYQVCD